MYRAETLWESDERGGRFDRVIEGLVIGLLAFMPLAFGAVEAWSEQIVIALAAAISICFVLKKLGSQAAPVTRSWVYVPVMAFLLVVVIQLIPLPTSFVRVVSPHTALLKTELLEDVPNSSQVLSRLTFSFYAHATRHDLRMVLAVAAVFAVVLNVYRRPDQIKRLLLAIVIIGGTFALLSLAQTVVGSNKIYWLVPLPDEGIARSGPFVNHSHYGQFMNLSVGAALALVLVKLREAFGRSETSPGQVADYLGSPEARGIWALIGMMMLATCTIFLSMTRGGMISTLAAATFTAVALSFNRSLRDSGWIIAFLAMGAFVCVLYLGFDAVYDRLGTLSNLEYAQGNRLQILKDVAVAWMRFPVLGAGLGTHEYVYPMFDRSVIPLLAAHAENEYAQSAEETGLMGLSALLVFGGMIAFHYRRAVRCSEVPVCAAVYGLGFGLVAILIHSLSDFGQHLPANAFLSAIFCALIVRLSHLGTGADTAATAIRSNRAVWIGVLVVACLVWGWTLLEANAARVAEAHWSQVLALEKDLAERDWQGSDEEYRYLLTRAVGTQESEPGNVKYRHWLNTYRWRAISRPVDPNVDPAVLIAEMQRFTKLITDELNQARVLCPTFGATWVVLGQLERSVLGLEEEGARHIRKGVELAPCDAIACLVAGMLEAEEQHVEASLRYLQKAVQLDKQYFGEAAAVMIEQLNLPDVAIELAQNDVNLLSRLVALLETSEGQSESADRVRRQMTELLERRCESPDAPAYVFEQLARIYQGEGRDGDAIECLRRAVTLNYDRTDWRYRLAGLLAKAGRDLEAAEQLEICVSLHPEFEAARTLLRQLNQRVR